MSHYVRRPGIRGLLFAVVSAASAGPGHAAVNVCQPELAGKQAEAKTELEARKGALQDWTQQAEKIGRGYTRWQIAFNRRIDCTKTAAGTFQCQAVGQPCTVEQVPTPDLQPIRRGPSQ